jgi:hypothetical protein
VRVCLAVALPARARVLATRCQALVESDDSRIATQQLHGAPEIPSAFDRDFGPQRSYVLRRPIRSPALRSDNRNPKRNHRMGVGVEICTRQNFGSASIAKESVQAQSTSFAAIERDPQRFILTSDTSSEKPFADTPLTSILSPQAGRGGMVENRTREASRDAPH